MANTDRDPALRVVTPVDPEEELLASLRLDPAQADAVAKIPVTLQTRRPLKHEFIRVIGSGRLTSVRSRSKTARATTPASMSSSRTYRARCRPRRRALCFGPMSPGLACCACGRSGSPTRMGGRTNGTARPGSPPPWPWRMGSRDRQQALGGYELFEAINQPPDPEWPELSFGHAAARLLDRGRVVEASIIPWSRRSWAAVTLDDFEEVWFADLEFCAPAGERPDPVCVVARELRSGRLVRQWRDAFSALPPFPIGGATSTSPSMPAPSSAAILP